MNSTNYDVGLNSTHGDTSDCCLNSTLDTISEGGGEWGAIKQPAKVTKIILSVAAMLFNAGTCLALCQVRMRLKSHCLLLLSLAGADFLIGLSVCSITLNEVFTSKHQFCTFLILKACNNTALLACVLTLTLLAMDHYLAVARPLHKSLLFTNRKCRLMIVITWFLSAIGGFSAFLVGLIKGLVIPNCSYMYESNYHEEYVVFASTILTILAMSYLYCSVYAHVKARPVPVTSQQRRVLQQNRRTLRTLLLIVSTFLVCWLPVCLYQLTLIALVKTQVEILMAYQEELLLVDSWLYTLLPLNSILDALIYAARIPTVQHGYRR